MIGIIGAGPIGNYLASLLAQKGFSVTVFEDHKKIGVPIQCTGITTVYLQDIMKISKEFMVNTIHRTKVYAPNMDSVEIPLRKNFIFDVRDVDGRMMVGITNQPTQEVFADSPTKWLYRSVDVTLEFDLRAKGPACALTLHQNGIAQRAKRVRE